MRVAPAFSVRSPSLAPRAAHGATVRCCPSGLRSTLCWETREPRARSGTARAPWHHCQCVRADALPIIQDRRPARNPSQAPGLAVSRSSLPSFRFPRARCFACAHSPAQGAWLSAMPGGHAACPSDAVMLRAMPSTPFGNTMRRARAQVFLQGGPLGARCPRGGRP